MSNPQDVVSVADLPVAFHAKYMGMQPARGLWGIKHTRKPVDIMVQQARTLPPDTILPMVKVTVSTKGIDLQHISGGKKESHTFHPIDTISYGVQDMVYTRVFSMIVVKNIDLKVEVPFECHAFVCDSKNTVRRLTYALAAAFQEYSKCVREEGIDPMSLKKKFAIDLRTPEEIQGDGDNETDA